MEVPLSKVSPDYLHSNSTSHTWAFSAAAELIDNAYDPDVAASELWIDWEMINGKQCLTFVDNGKGMDHTHLLHMLSFGYCEKAEFEALRTYKPIGKYGNGFKSGSMRLAKDALVFTVCRNTASVGFLSQTYLKAINSDCVRVPMVEFSLRELKVVSEESRKMLETIVEFSPYSGAEAIKRELKRLTEHRTHTGTKIVLFNLKRHKNGRLELDFESDIRDIRNPEAHAEDDSAKVSRATQNETSEYRFSLRCYCSILFLVPRMKIYIRKVKVKNMPIAKSLSKTEEDTYRPSWLDKPLGITFGFVPSKTKNNIDDYGVMFYHRNRLIKTYEKIGYQKQPNDLGVGVVGVVQVDFLTPTHNKQDFVKDEKYNALISALSLKLNDYWNEKKSRQSNKQESQAKEEPDSTWVQCDTCLKWRRLPTAVPDAKLPDKWFCRMNPDPTHNRCDLDEESYLEGEFTKPYVKTHKQQLNLKKRSEKEVLSKTAQELAEKALTEVQKIQSEQKKTQNMPQTSTTSQGQMLTPENRKRKSGEQLPGSSKKIQTGKEVAASLLRATTSGQTQQAKTQGGSAKSCISAVLSATFGKQKPATIQQNKSSPAKAPEAASSTSYTASQPSSRTGVRPPFSSQLGADADKTKQGEAQVQACSSSSVMSPSTLLSTTKVITAEATTSTDDLVWNNGNADHEHTGEESNSAEIMKKQREEYLQLEQQHEELKDQFVNLKRNVHSLLSHVIDDYDYMYEEGDVEQAVKELTSDNFAKLETVSVAPEALPWMTSSQSKKDSSRCVVC